MIMNLHNKKLSHRNNNLQDSFIASLYN